MKPKKLFALIALGAACAFPVAAQQSGGGTSGSQGASSQQSAAGGQSAPEAQRREEGTNWSWIGLLGLIGLAGLRRRPDHVDRDRPYTGGGSRGAT
jgi:hypothetical protein